MIKLRLCLKSTEKKYVGWLKVQNLNRAAREKNLHSLRQERGCGSLRDTWKMERRGDMVENSQSCVCMDKMNTKHHKDSRGMVLLIERI